MGGDSWYGAEEVWGTDAFKNRVNDYIKMMDSFL